jgi:hypothetical protein
MSQSPEDAERLVQEVLSRRRGQKCGISIGRHTRRQAGVNLWLLAATLLPTLGSTVDDVVASEIKNHGLVGQILEGSTPANTAAVRVDVVPGSTWRYSGGGYTVMQQMMICSGC